MVTYDFYTQHLYRVVDANNKLDKTLCVPFCNCTWDATIVQRDNSIVETFFPRLGFVQSNSCNLRVKKHNGADVFIDEFFPWTPKNLFYSIAAFQFTNIHKRNIS